MKYKGEKDIVWQTKYSHTYLVSSYTDLKAQRRHWCLGSGNWCWQNLFEHPLDICLYLKKKLKRLSI